MGKGHYENLSGNNGAYPPPQNSSNNHLPSPNWLCPSFPRDCPYCGLKFMNFYKLGGHLTAHRREMQESNRQVMGTLAGRNLTPGHHPQASGGAGPSRSTGPVVQLGVLQPRVENGHPCPPTLDLFGLRKVPDQDGDDDSEKTVIDLDPEGNGDIDGPLCKGKNKRVRI